MSNEQFDPLRAFISAFSIASFAGLASLLRSGRKLTKLAIVSAMLNSGLVGLTIALLWFTYFRDSDNLYFLIGVCILAGLGGGTIIEFGLAVLKNGGVTINVSHDAASKRRAAKEDSDDANP